MVNVEHRNFSEKENKIRKIEIYRKNTAELDKDLQEEPTDNAPKNNKKISLKVLKLIVFGSFFLIFAVIILKTFLINPFLELQKEADIDKKNTIGKTEEEIGKPMEPEQLEKTIGSFFFKEDGSPSKFAFLVLGLGGLFIFNVLTERMRRL